MPKISVIVPVYKAEAYLHRCVDSILAQTFTDWELLLIDDGSPDRSGEICDEYAKKDSRIRVIHKENGGVSSARQRGLDESIGEYTIHADPDDWVEPTMLAEMYQKAKDEDADIVMTDFFQNNGHSQEYIKQKPIEINRKEVLRELLFQQLHGSCCNKLVRRVCYSRNGISFPYGMCCWEDLYVNVCLLTNDVKIAYLPKAFYHYDCAENQNSLVRKPTKKTVLSQKYFIETLGPVLGVDYEEAFYKMKMQTKELAWRYDVMNEYEYKGLFPEIRDRYISDFSKTTNIIKHFVILSFRHYKIAKTLFKCLLRIKNLKSYGK